MIQSIDIVKVEFINFIILPVNHIIWAVQIQAQDLNLFWIHIDIYWLKFMGFMVVQK